MDVIQTGTNIATVKISELPKSTETNGRATLATNEQTNQSEALELTKVAGATQRALAAAQTANRASQTALASAATANQAAHAADTARENIAGDLAQKSSMFTGAIMGKGYFGQNSPAWLESETKTYRVVFKTGTELQENRGVLDTANSSYGVRIFVGIGYIRIYFNGYNVFDVNANPNYLYEVIIVNTPTDCYAWCNTSKSPILQRAETYLAPKRFWLGCMASASDTLKGNIISAQVFNFAFTGEDAAASWNGGHPELWRVPDAWRKEGSSKRLFVDLIPASLTPTVWKDISGQGNNIPYVPLDSNPDECEMAYANMGFPDTIIGTEAPAVIPNFIGQRYIDTTNKAEYTAFGMTSASDWK